MALAIRLARDEVTAVTDAAEYGIHAAGTAISYAAQAGSRVYHAVTKVAKAIGHAAVHVVKTKVLLADGKAVPISSLKPGEKVLATNTKTGKNKAETITAVMFHDDHDLYDLKVRADGRTAVIDTTRNHLFWDQDSHRWIKAAALKYGTHLRTPGGGQAVALGGHAPSNPSGWMWDLTITPSHDFYVQADSTAVLVHNCDFSGGRYGDLESGDGIELHHMPAKSISPLSKDDGPAIQMEKLDHYQTASRGRSAAAGAYRAQQQALIQAGRFDDAMQMDIDDVTSKFPGKYDNAILEMIDSLGSRP